MFLKLAMCAVIGLYGVKGQILSFCPAEQIADMEYCVGNTTHFQSISISEVPGFYSSPPPELCSYQSEFISLVKCVFDVLRSCFEESFNDIFPTDAMNENTVNYLCTRIDSYNSTCLFDSILSMIPCYYNGLDLTFSDPSYEGLKAYICQSQKNGKNCMDNATEFATCPETQTTYLKLLKIQNPGACGGQAGYESGTFGIENL